MTEIDNVNSLNSIIPLINDIKIILRNARHKTFYAVNTEMLKAYFEIGRKIVEEEQKGSKRAAYGRNLLETLSKELKKEFGNGYSLSTLKNIRLFYKIYNEPISQTVSGQFYKLTWSHYCELIKIDEELKRRYFEKYAITENLSVRELKRQIYSLHYERLLLSKDKKGLMAFDAKNNVPDKPEDIIKDPYVLEFLDLDEKHGYVEKDLEGRILSDLQKFLLELGQGFSFVARQKRITIDNDHFYIDLLFYNIYLRCYIVIELKTGKFKPEDAGQLNFYLNYVKKEMNQENDSEPIGIILCTQKENVQVEFAFAGLSNKLFVSKYKLYLPTKEELEKEVRKLL